MCINTTNQQAGNPRLNRAIKHLRDIRHILMFACSVHLASIIPVDSWYIYTQRNKYNSANYNHCFDFATWYRIPNGQLVGTSWRFSERIAERFPHRVAPLWSKFWLRCNSTITPLDVSASEFCFEQHALYVLESYDHFNYSCKWFVFLMNDESLSSSRYTFRPFVEIKHDPTSLE